MRKQGWFLLFVLFSFSHLFAEGEEKGTFIIKLSTDRKTPKIHRVAVRLVNDLKESRFYCLQGKESVSALQTTFTDSLPPGGYKVQLLTPCGLKPADEASDMQIAISSGESIVIEKLLALNQQLSFESEELEKLLQEQRLQKEREEKRVQEKRLESKRLEEQIEQKRLQDKRLEEKRLEWERQRRLLLS